MNAKTWTEHSVRAGLVAAMLACVISSLAGLIGLFLAGMDVDYVSAFASLTAVEAYISYHLMHAWRRRLTSPLRVRAIELFLLFLALQLGANVSEGRVNILAGLPDLSPAAFTSVMLVLLAWVAATETADDLARLGEPPERDRYYVPPGQLLANRFFLGGAILLVSTGLTRVGLSQALDFSRTAIGGPVLNALIYFLLGMVLLGQARYITLQREWEGQATHVSGELTRRWIRYSVLFILLVACLSFLLPTGYTTGLLDVLAIIGGLLLWAFVLLMNLLLLPLAWLIAFLTGNNFDPALGPRLPSPPVPPPPPDGSGGVDWLSLLRSFAFWIAVLVVLAYLFRHYLRHHPTARRALAQALTFYPLRRLWTALWHRIRGYATTVAALPRRVAGRTATDAGLEGEAHRSGGGPHSSRERVREHYLSTLRRADKAGLGRRQTDTPYEYDTTTASHLRGGTEELSALTEAFVEARYSRHDIGPEQADRAQRHSRGVEAALGEFERRAADGRKENERGS